LEQHVEINTAQCIELNVGSLEQAALFRFELHVFLKRVRLCEQRTLHVILKYVAQEVREAGTAHEAGTTHEA
jgi:hypothetical protein